MPIILSSIRTAIDQPEQAAVEQAIEMLGAEHSRIRSAQIAKVSLDARRQEKITLVYSVQITLTGGEEEAAAKAAARFGANAVKYLQTRPLSFPKGKEKLVHPIVVVGFGPAGMFAALTLAEQGYPVLVLERGSAIDRRVEAVEGFWRSAAFSARTNVQFGEGGAGAFSDGKLTTRISDDRCGYVLERFAAFGAPADILVKAKPHIGTDRLRDVVKNLRERICALGGQVLFDTAVEDLVIRGGRLCALRTSKGEIETDAAVFAIGHSARDTFSMLDQRGLAMEAKPFSVGARIEHLQETIDRGLYGRYAGHPRLPKGEYQLSYREGGRGVYTFCMCPGGTVVPSSSEEGTVVTNGMSLYARDGKNANAALVVSVSPADFGTHPLDGIRFQRRLEEQAFLLGGGNYRAPAQDVGSFLEGKPGIRLGRVEPSYAIGITGCDFNRLYPKFVLDLMRTGLRKFDRKLHGFGAADAILTGPETRTSSPVRILRREDCMALNLPGFYPCGEGAGYAGGIMSAAVDGVRVAQAVIGAYRP